MLHHHFKFTCYYNIINLDDECLIYLTLLWCCVVWSASLPDLVYHRIDILPTNNMCLHLKQLATTGTQQSLMLYLPAWVTNETWNSEF